MMKRIYSILTIAISLISSVAGQIRDKVTIGIVGNFHIAPAIIGVSLTEYTGETDDDNIVEALLLQSDIKGRLEDAGKYLDGTATSKAALDLVMLTQGWRRYDVKTLQQDSISTMYPMETEQTICGHIKGTFHKIKTPKLRLLIPKTGYQAELQLVGNDTFCIRGLDFVDGTTIQLQAMNKKNSDAFITLHVAEKQYPKIKSSRVESADSSMFFQQVAYDSTAIRRLDKWAFELPDVAVAGRKIKPLNARGFEPDRFIEEGNPYLEKSPNMELLLGRLGLQVGTAQIYTDDKADSIYVRCFGRRVRNDFLAAEVKLDDDRISEYALEDILNIHPNEIKQIEYFLPSNYELYGNLSGLKGLYGNANLGGGLLLIYTKSPVAFSRFRHNRPASLQTVRQLGYKPPVEFYVPQHSAQRDYVPTLYWNPYFLLNQAAQSLTIGELEKDKKYLLTIEGVSNSGEITYKNEIIKP